MGQLTKVGYYEITLEQFGRGIRFSAKHINLEGTYGVKEFTEQYVRTATMII